MVLKMSETNKLKAMIEFMWRIACKKQVEQVKVREGCRQQRDIRS